MLTLMMLNLKSSCSRQRGQSQHNGLDTEQQSPISASAHAHSMHNQEWSTVASACLCAASESLHSRQEEDMESTMDQIFGGILRSDVVCATCGYTSTAHDPFKDISVDIPEVLKHIPQPPHVDTPKPNPVKSGRGRGNGRGSNGEDTPSACLVKKSSVS